MRCLAGGLLAATLVAACSGSDVTEPLEPPGISVSVPPGSVRLLRGQSGTLYVSLQRNGGFAGPVAFEVLGAPPGVTPRPDVVPPEADIAVLHLDVAVEAAAGTTILSIRATASGVQSVAVDVPLTILGVAPPFWGTIFIDPDIITQADPTTFIGLSYAGRESRTMYDRRVSNWITLEPYLFLADFDDGLHAEVQVNPEFGSPEAAQVEAERYAEVIGRLPTALRTDVETVWIHRGTNPFGGGNRNLLIHTGQADLYEEDGILEETFVHEAAHTSLDAYHAAHPNWVAAQVGDGTFISTYAQDNPTREDIAESYLTYLAVRYRSDRISPELGATIRVAIPFRFAYFDQLPLDMYPIVPRAQER
ncbi:MAG TPA: hypothetical protein VLA36_10660 [Longimicrobiales bacterium]|nr:hypothetical protein [Longimicrobiales bacterium]